MIFLDIDGVLRRSGSPLYKLEPELVRAFEEWVSRLPEPEIVITSTWRMGFTLEEIRDQFARAGASSGLVLKVMGKTPALQERPDRPYHRQAEIRAYLKKHGLSETDWIALDDRPELFEPGCRNVVLFDPEVGFEAERVGARLTNLA